MTTTIQRLTEQTRRLPNGGKIADSGWVLAGFGQHRDSDPLEQSNFAVALKILAETVGMSLDNVMPLGTPWRDQPNDDSPVAVARFGHWAVGWVEEIMIRADDTALISAATDLIGRVESYPVLDDEHFYQHEWDTNHPDGDTLCYSDDPDCGCGRETC